MTQNIEDSIAQMAFEIDKAMKQVSIDHCVAAMRSSDPYAPMPPLSAEDVLKVQVIRELGRKKIAEFLMERLTPDTACQLAATYVIRATIYKRLADAKSDALQDARKARERLTDRVRDKEEQTKHLRQKNSMLPASVRRDQARLGAIAKDKKMRMARHFVVAEWQLHRVNYDNNKSEFARTYVGIVKERFTNLQGDPLVITEKQMREVWLKDTPSTSKPDGLLAAGE